jgi:hypothetical protein
MESKNIFDKKAAAGALSLLAQMVSPPPSDRVMASSLIKKIILFLDQEANSDSEIDPVKIWNFYKELLDETVRYSLGSSFVVKILNLEPCFEPPKGSYSETFQNMSEAPWRQNKG